MDEEPEEVEVDLIGGLGLLEADRAEMPGQGKGVGAQVLQAPFVQLSDVVQRAVVVRDPSGGGDLKARPAGVEEHAQIGVAAGSLEECDAVRGRHRVRRGLGELVDHPAALVVGRQHQCRTGITAGVEVQHHADVAGPRMLLDKGAGAEQPALLTVGEQEDHIVAQRRRSLEGAQGLQHGRHPGSVVGGAGAGGYGVVVGREQEGLATGVGSRQPSQHVLRPPRLEEAGDGIVGRGRPLDLRCHAQPAELADQVVADRSVGW